MIRKCAAIIIQNKKLLVVRKRGTTVFISPGGKIEPGETQRCCLRRELREELGVELIRATFFGTFERPSAFEKMDLQTHVWSTEVSGNYQALAEIEELRWITGSAEISVGSVFGECVIPVLVNQGLIHE